MEEKYKGMTVNERLHVSGLMNKFDDAVKSKDVPELKYILNQIQLDNSSIEDILKSLKLI